MKNWWLIATGALLLSSSVVAQTVDQSRIEAMKKMAAKQGITLTDDEARRMIIRQLEVQMQMQSMMNAAASGQSMPMPVPVIPGTGLVIPLPTGSAFPGQTTSSAQTSLPKESEASLAARLPKPLPLGASALRVSLKRGGIAVNGSDYFDPNGPIKSVSANSTTGRIGYIVERPDQRLILRTGLGSDSSTAITIGEAQETENGVVATTVTGETLSGDMLFVTPDGFSVSRDAALFRYVAGKGVQTHVIPEGWNVAGLQSGEMGTTETILLQTTATAQQNETDRSPLSSLRSLGSSLGMKQTPDFAFYGLSNKLLVPLNIDSGGQSVSKGVNCRRVSALVNKCQGFQTYDALFEPDGRVNHGHYFWHANWFALANGNFGVAVEGGRRLFAINLNSGERTLLKSRGLGLGAMVAERSNDGTVVIILQRGFIKEKIENLSAAIEAAKLTPIKP